LEPHKVAHMRLVLFVMGVKLFRLRDHAAIKRVLLLAHHLHHDGFLHAAGDYLADNLLSLACRFGGGLSFCHYFFSVARAADWRSRAIVLTRAMSLRNPRIFFKLSVCPMLSWNFSLNS